MVMGRRSIIQALILPALASCLSAAPGFVSACDLNSDGLVNVIDIQLAIDQALGISSCTTGDLNGDSQCTVLDVQRIINAALGAGLQSR